jgi:tetratricopeptide (TPR) repeat protein
VLSRSSQSIGVTGTALSVGMHGMGGIGKSVLATMLARDKEVQATFPDGVFWITLGQEPTLTLRQLDFARMLGDGSLIFQDVQQGKVHLSQLLGDRNCFLILDDVWKVDHLAAFNVLGEQSQLLFTTRDSSIVKALGAIEHQVNLLNNNEALELLANCSGQCKEILPNEAIEIVKECGNLPLALSMVGAIAKDRSNRWDNLLYKLRNADLDKIRHHFPDYPYPDLLKAIQVSVDFLEPEVKICYLDFAVFPEDVAIPEATLRTFWEPEGLDKYDTQDVIDMLVERSLARRDEAGNLTLHALQYDYVRKQITDLPLLHNKLLDAYANYCSEGWHTYPADDGYFFEHLAHHLKEAGRRDELFMLARDSKFAEIQQKVLVNEPSVLLKTVQTALKAAIEIDNLPAIAEFLLRHAHQLTEITEPESPLQVLRSGNVTRALKLVELYSSVDLYVILALLIAWELKEVRKEDAQILLKKLQSRLSSIELPNFLANKKIMTWQGDLAAYALAQVFEIDIAGCTILSQRLLGGSGSRYWAIFEQALCKRGLFSEAIKLGKQQHDLRCLIGIAELQAQTASLEEVQTTYCEIFDLLRSLGNPPYWLSWVAHSAEVLLKMGNNNLARHVFTYLVKTVNEIQEFDDRVKALLNIVHYQIESGVIDQSFLEDALATLQEVNVSEVIHPSIKSKFLGEMARLSIKSGDDAQAKNYLNQALEIAQIITEEEVKQVTLKDLVATQASCGLTESALKTARMIANHTYQIQAFSYILDSQIKENNFKAALKTVEQDHWDKSHSLLKVSQAQAEAQQIEEAIKTAEQIPTDWERDAAWISIVKAQEQALLKSGYDEQMANEIFKTIEQKIKGYREQAQALMTIAGIQLEQMDFAAAIQTLERIKQSGDRASAEKLLAIAYARADNFDEAFAIVKKIENSQIHIEALEAIAKIQRQIDRTDDARKTYAEMLTASPKSNVFSLKAVALMNIANTQAEGEQKQNAANILQWAAEDVEAVGDLFIKSQLLAFLAEKWAQVGELKTSEQGFKQAGELAERADPETKEMLNSPQVITTIAISKARVGGFNADLEKVEQIPFLPLKAEIYLAIANVQKKTGDIALQQKLKRLLADAYENFESSPLFEFSDPVQIFCKLAIAQLAIGDTSEAKDNLTQLYNNYAKDETNRKVKSEQLASIAIAFTQLSDIDAAVAMLNEIEAPKWRIEVLWKIAYAQFKQNQIGAVKQSLQLATDAYQKIPDESQRAESIGNLAKIQALAGEYCQAICSVESALDQHVTLLPELADIFVDLGKVEYLKQLIIPCSYHLESAYEMCQSLAQLYPEQALAIAGIIRNSPWHQVGNK